MRDKFKKYSWVGEESEGLVPVKFLGRYGYANEDGKLVIPAKFNSIVKFQDGYAVVEKRGKQGLIDNQGDFILECKYDNIDYNSQNGYRLKQDGKWGYADKDGKAIVECKYDNIDREENGYRLEQNGKCGYADNNGNVILECKYDDFDKEEYGYYVSDDGKYGLLDNDGKTIFNCEYSNIRFSKASDGYVLTKDGKEGFGDKNGNIILKCEYDHILRQSPLWESAYFEVQRGNKFGVVSIDGRIIFDCLYDNFSSYGKFYFKVQQGNKFGIIDKYSGKIICECIYDGISGRGKGFVVKQGEKFGFVGADGQIVFNPKYDDFYYNQEYSEFLKFTKKEDGDVHKAAYVNASNCKLICDDQYDEAFDSPRMVFVKKNGKMGAINENGELICKPIYDNVEALTNLHVCVEKENKKGCIRNDGVVIIKCEYDNFWDYGYGFIVKQNDKLGFINYNGKVICDCKYDDIELSMDNYHIKVIKDGKYGLINKDGNVICDCIYDDIRLEGVNPIIKVKQGENWSVVENPYIKNIIKEMNLDLRIVLRDGKYSYESRNGQRYTDSEIDSIIEYYKSCKKLEEDYNKEIETLGMITPEQEKNLIKKYKERATELRDNFLKAIDNDDYNDIYRYDRFLKLVSPLTSNFTKEENE